MSGRDRLGKASLGPASPKPGPAGLAPPSLSGQRLYPALLRRPGGDVRSRNGVYPDLPWKGRGGCDMLGGARGVTGLPAARPPLR